MSCTNSNEKINLSRSRSTCRVCMRKNSSLKELFGSDCKIVDRIQFCTGILFIESPNLPSLICAECLSHLNIAHNFKTTCITSDELFQTIDVKVEVKTEIFDDTVKEEIDLYDNEIEVDNSNETMGLLIEKEPDINTDIVKPPSPGPTEEITEGIAEQSLNSTANTIKLKDVCIEKQAIIKEQPATKKVQNKRTKKVKEKKPRKKRIRQIVFRKQMCVKCNLRFDSKEESIEHHETLHNTSKYVCEVCGKQFIYQASHNAHMRIHAGPSFACAHCSYTTVNKPDLRTHMTLHTGEKNFHCHACPGAFRTSSNLQNHIRHNHGGQKTFPCDRCDKSFFSGHRLRRHMDAHNNVKRHSCAICHSCFMYREKWKRHLWTQHSVKVPRGTPGPPKTNLNKESTSILFEKKQNKM